jgi:hypothetical protein
MNTWYLGIHRSNWLSRPELAEVPVLISRRVFPLGAFPRAVGRYAIDSGGFTELQTYGRWTITPKQYVSFLRRAWEETGPFDFAAPMDWMCEPAIINGGVFHGQRFVGTRLPLKWHQRYTTRDGIRLREMAPELPIRYVLQGDREDDYLRHFDMYASAGVDLAAEPLVGLGSVCRRQSTVEVAFIIDALWARGLTNLHGFGFKIEGLRNCWHKLASADSLSASKDGRHAGPCQHPTEWRRRDPATGELRQPISEANCLAYFLAWRQQHVQPPSQRRTLHLQEAFDLTGAAA